MPTVTSRDSLRLAQAAAWRVRLEDSDPAQRAAFERWLVESEHNAEAWRSVQGPWNLLGTHATAADVLALRRAALVGATPPEQARVVSRRALAGASAIALLVALAGFFFQTGREHADVYRTGVNERRVLHLADGSELALDSASEVRVRFTRRARQLQLERGQARFTVAHDGRPFTVAAGSREVVATGTVFNVDLLKDSLVVTLLQGKVRVVPESRSEAGSAAKRSGTLAALPADAVELNAGEQLSIDSAGVLQRRPADIAGTTAWEAGRFIFRDERLGDVVQRFSRHTARTLRLDERISDLRISGVFDANDVDGFLTTLTAYLPVRSRVDGAGAIDVVSARQ